MSLLVQVGAGQASAAGHALTDGVGVVCESCRLRLATLSWSHPRAGAAFQLCSTCAPTTDPTDRPVSAPGGEG